MSTFVTYYSSPIGLIKICGTEHCINELNFVEQPDSSETILLPPLAISCTEQLIEYFQGARRTFDFPVDQSGTPFQKKVWYELMNIPFGRTISYMELSRRLGDTKSIRAAAAANGKNQLAIIVPCHRVVGSKNDLIGYAGGLWRKRWLLDLEKRVAYGVQTLF
jgi:methylated-DNA-[protein]-cysteine S-methyltransferase